MQTGGRLTTTIGFKRRRKIAGGADGRARELSLISDDERRCPGALSWTGRMHQRRSAKNPLIPNGRWCYGPRLAGASRVSRAGWRLGATAPAEIPPACPLSGDDRRRAALIPSSHDLPPASASAVTRSRACQAPGSRPGRRIRSPRCTAGSILARGERHGAGGGTVRAVSRWARGQVRAHQVPPIRVAVIRVWGPSGSGGRR